MVVRETALGWYAWIQILALLFPSCVTLAKLLNLSVPQFHLLRNGYVHYKGYVNNSAPFIELLWKMNEMTFV